MNKNSVRIFNQVVDRQLELSLLSASHVGPLADLTVIRKYYAAWRKRGDELTSKELEKEYGLLE